MSRKMTEDWKMKFEGVVAATKGIMQLEKIHCVKSGRLSVERPLFAVFELRPVKDVWASMPYFSGDPQSVALQRLAWFVEHLGDALAAEKTESAREVDLSAETRFAMKEAAAAVFGVSTDDLRLVQAGRQVFIFPIAYVVNFRKTGKSYVWEWAKGL